jgi:hypothetical protein
MVWDIMESYPGQSFVKWEPRVWRSRLSPHGAVRVAWASDKEVRGHTEAQIPQEGPVFFMALWIRV